MKILITLCLVLSTWQSVNACTASWYGPGFHGRKMSNGKIYNMHNMTAAHKSIKLNTWVLVKSKNRYVRVKVTDRLPKNSKRCIDLSYQAAKRLKFVSQGLTKVNIKRI